ncbi:hypothetical protein [Cupriavidus campinensis]|uniref:Uncharacterized protein n=1 Tax=Cupriavidus campinensis TaxID=151783 RepID=A0ABY3EGD3_9BURK|nr:hypothetical protein [Cupriavidus campinensis]TSP09977.1 hypothetical protein FGG12_24865 [Cupriavidus campinensis]
MDIKSLVPPTDNIFKFYAVTGLILVIFAFSGAIYTVKHKNQFLIDRIVELRELESKSDPSPGEKAKSQMLARLIEIENSDAEFLKWACAVLAGIGTAGMFWGFSAWHRTQGKVDELAELGAAKLRAEIAAIRRSNRTRRH